MGRPPDYVGFGGGEGGYAVGVPNLSIEATGVRVKDAPLHFASSYGPDFFFEMLYEAPVLAGDLFSLRQAAYLSAFPPPSRWYVAGYILYNAYALFEKKGFHAALMGMNR